MRISAPSYILVALIFLLSACGKDDDNTKTACRITGATRTAATSTSVFTFNYSDIDEKLTSITRETDSANGDNSQGEVLLTYYSGNTISAITTRDTGIFVSRDSMIFNAGWLLRKDHYTNAAGTIGTTTTYSYQTNGELFRVVTSDLVTGTIIKSVDYTYANGNLISTTDTTSYSYYIDRPSANGDYLQVIQMLNNGVVYLHNANLVQSINNKGVIANLSYQTDGNGRITRISRTGGNTGDFTIDIRQLCY